MQKPKLSKVIADQEYYRNAFLGIIGIKPQGESHGLLV